MHSPSVFQVVHLNLPRHSVGKPSVCAATFSFCVSLFASFARSAGDGSSATGRVALDGLNKFRHILVVIPNLRPYFDCHHGI